MAVPNKTVYLPPQLISYEDINYYLQMNPSGCVLYSEHSASPIYQIQEPLLLIQGMAASTQQVHLVMIKTNGDLCYTLINGSGQNQTTILTKLDVRSTRYRRLLLFPLGKTVHIFYASTHQAIPDLWRIEHLFWDGKAWRSVNLGEVVHSREPLYDIVLDRKGNLHLLMMTFQGRQTLILTNRFNGSFYLWGNTTQAFQLQQEVIDMTSIMTPDNIHHLIWLAKTPIGKLELGWAYRAEVQEFSSNWFKAPAALQTLNGPVRGLGSVEINGGLWLLVNAEVEMLLLYKGDSWKQVLSNAPTHQPLRYVRKNNSSYYNAYWLEESHNSHTPAYHQHLGLNFTPIPPQINQSAYIPPPAPAPNPTPQPAYIDHPVFTTQPIALTTQPRPLTPVITPVEEVIPDTSTLTKSIVEPILNNSIPEENSPQPETLKSHSIQETLTKLETGPNIPEKEFPTESNTLTTPTPNEAEVILQTPLENPANNPAPSESDQNQKKSKSRILRPKKTRKKANPCPALNTGSIASDDSLPVFAPSKVSLLDHDQDVNPQLILTDSTENLNQVLTPIITQTLDPFLKTIVGLESQVNQLQNEKDMAWQKIDQQLAVLQQERESTFQKIEDYLSRIDSEKESSLQKFEQQINLLQQNDATNQQKIEQFISTIQLEKAKEHEKGFWAKWFK